MKTIVAGTRSFNDYSLMTSVISQLDWEITEVVSGHASGADRLGEKWAKEHSVPCKVFPADWKLGKSAGYLRNREMGEYAQALVLFWDGYSKGSKHMLNIAKDLDLKIKVVIYGGEDL